MDDKAGRRSFASVLGETRTEVQQRLQGEGSRGGITDSRPPVAAPTLESVMAMLERMSRQQSELQLLTSALRSDVQHLTGKFYEVLQGVTVPPAGLPTVGSPNLEPQVDAPGSGPPVAPLPKTPPAFVLASAEPLASTQGHSVSDLQTLASLKADSRATRGYPVSPRVDILTVPSSVSAASASTHSEPQISPSSECISCLAADGAPSV